ncbi:hypothetical protein PROCOU_06323 [Listeria rocourtiae FSL F6-920]|nr:hypothetical protein PROCOU_06323 [Listeria rocourtiae FSL F6-920]
MKQYVRIICAILCCLVIAGCGPNEVKTSEQTQEPQKKSGPCSESGEKASPDWEGYKSRDVANPSFDVSLY